MSLEISRFAEAGREYSVGVDCEDVIRWRRMLKELEVGPRRGLFTEREHRYCRSFTDPSPHYAARWCAREALVKALAPLIIVDIRRLEVRVGPDGRPALVIDDPALAAHDLAIRLSLSHSRETAIAIVIVSFVLAKRVAPDGERVAPRGA